MKSKILKQGMLLMALISVIFAGGYIIARGGAGVRVSKGYGNYIGGKQPIVVGGVCQNNVFNKGANDIFIPDNASEWAAASSSIGSGNVSNVSLGACNLCSPLEGFYEVLGCTEFWNSSDVAYTNYELCAAQCAILGASACEGLGGTSGPYCWAFSGAGCYLAPHQPLWGSICSYR